MRPAWLATALLAAVGCKGKAEVKTSAEVDLAVEPGAEEEPAPTWDAPTGGERAARAIEAPAHWQGPPTATYPGFQVFDDGTSRVFVEIAGGSVAVEEIQQDGVYRYRFVGVRVPERVNRLPLPTLHFDTPVSLVEVTQVGSDAELVIHTRYRVRPRPRLARSASGTVLSVDFPLGPAEEPLPSQEPKTSPPKAISAEETVPSAPPAGGDAPGANDDELSTRR